MAPLELMAILSAKPGQKDEMIKILMGFAEKVKVNEPGCLRYELILPEDPSSNQLAMLETFASKEAHEIHNSTDYFKTGMEALAAVSAGEFIVFTGNVHGGIALRKQG